MWYYIPMRKHYSQALLPIFALLPTIANAQWLYLVQDSLGRILDRAIPVLVGVALAVFMWNIVIFIRNSGNEQAYGDARRRIFWGIIILFVIISMWGFVRLLQILVGVPNTSVVAPQVVNTAGAT